MASTCPNITVFCSQVIFFLAVSRLLETSVSIMTTSDTLRTKQKGRHNIVAVHVGLHFEWE